MTNLIIHSDTNTRREYLLKSLSELLGHEITQISQLLTNPDIHIIENTSNLNISIDDVKSLQKGLVYQPFEEKYQVGIIFYGENLTVEAQNALLKTLEDDRKTTIFYILVNNEKSLLDTIISRGVKHYVKSDLSEDIEEEEEVSKPELLDMELHEQFAIIEETINKEKEDKESVGLLVDQLTKYYRQELHRAIKSNDLSGLETATNYLNELGTTSQRISMNVNKRVALENMIIALNKE